VYDVLHALCLAPSRQKSRIESLLGEWGGLQAEAAGVDAAFAAVAELPPGTLQFVTEWVTMECFGLMGRIVELGVRTELFAADEAEVGCKAEVQG